MGFFKSEKNSIISEYFTILHDLGALKERDAVEVILYENYLALSAPMIKQPLTLNYSQIKDVYYGAETEIIEKNKSAIGRAVVGGLLFGGAGAVVGAVSGTGKKEKKVNRIVFIINYQSANGDDCFLKFQDTRLFKGAKLSLKLKELCNIKPEEITAL